MSKFRIFVLLTVLILGCSEEDSLIPEVYTGKVTALKNGESWESLAYFDSLEHIPNRYILKAHVYNENSFWRETFDIRKLKASYEIQPIISYETSEPEKVSSHYNTMIDDGDVVGDIYSLDTTITNHYFQITDYDASKQEITGVFQVSFILTRDDGEGETPPQKLEFTDGKFTVKVNNDWFE
ncbi:hypothetical protein [Chondrinema litorale]|uniref:hypothetical protein n=1 Tax=Chondrinema litorale TaxID=2994555 RepID=UPI002542C4E3|nr:hypothetical protein [Chondrinema litorale]UZS00079.1 hypothetical protein OQ292_39760 [Chondrinema litorale]